jgi:tRNA(Ile)-lysidine synthase
VGPPPPVAAVRLAVRQALRVLEPDCTVLVACSGGADSLALAAALAHEARHEPDRRAGAVTVDHGLQPGSAARARSVAAHLVAAGLDPVETVHLRVAGPGGPEGAARRARREVLESTARRHGDAAVLLGHTRDDQAETVLLGLARGSGARSLGGMAPVTGRWLRPLLGLPRDAVRGAAPVDESRGLPWEDPHNDDPSYARSRLRHRVLPVLEAELGPGIAAALARTADLLRDDADALDAWAAGAPADPEGLDVAALAALPPAVRRRVLRRAALGAGSPATDLTAAHVRAVEALVTGWRGQSWVDLPGGVRARREGARVRLV